MLRAARATPPAAFGSMPPSGRTTRGPRFLFGHRCTLRRPQYRRRRPVEGWRRRRWRHCPYHSEVARLSGGIRRQPRRVANRRHRYPVLAGGNDHRGRSDTDRRRDVQDHRPTDGRCARARSILQNYQYLGRKNQKLRLSQPLVPR